VSVQTQKALLATTSTDPADGDGNPGPAVALAGAGGDYNVFVAKSGSGAEVYLLTVRCTTAGGADTGTSITPIATGANNVPGLGPWGVFGLAASLVAVASAALRRRARAGHAPGATA
jgi:hypothetical protein